MLATESPYDSADILICVLSLAGIPVLLCMAWYSILFPPPQSLSLPPLGHRVHTPSGQSPAPNGWNRFVGFVFWLQGYYLLMPLFVQQWAGYIFILFYFILFSFIFFYFLLFRSSNLAFSILSLIPPSLTNNSSNFLICWSSK